MPNYLLHSGIKTELHVAFIQKDKQKIKLFLHFPIFMHQNISFSVAQMHYVIQAAI